MEDGQDVAEGGPQAGGELRPSVGRDDRGDTEPLNPAREEGRCAVGSGDAAELDGFWPAGGAIDYREKIGEARRLWKGSYNVDMDVYGGVRRWLLELGVRGVTPSIFDNSNTAVRTAERTYRSRASRIC